MGQIIWFGMTLLGHLFEFNENELDLKDCSNKYLDIQQNLMSWPIVLQIGNMANSTTT